MALPEFSKLEEVPEQFRELYELKDGKAVPKTVEMDPDGLTEKGRLAIKRERESAETADKARKEAEKREKDLRDQLAAKTAGITDAALKELRGQVRKDLQAESAAEMTAKQAEIDALLAVKAENRSLKLDTKVKKMLLDAEVRHERVDALFILTANDYDLTEDGKPKLVNHPGMTIDQYARTELKKRFPEFFRGSQAAGGGTGGAYTSDGKPVGGTTADDVLKNPSAAATAARAAEAGNTR